MSRFVYAPPHTPWLQLCYRDDDIVVAIKPSGLLTVPGKAAEHKDSLELRLRRVYPGIRIVHRLDMATSGLLVLALHKKAQGELGKQFERRQVDKRYRAVVAGRLQHQQGEVNLPLRCDWPNRPKQMVCFEQGKASQTRYQVVASNGTCSEVLLYPVTGRSHQLRVHMQQQGCPILGDRLYGSAPVTAASSRLLLHAESIAFHHPISGKALHFEHAADFKGIHCGR